MTDSVKTAVERTTDGVVQELSRDDPARGAGRDLAMVNHALTLEYLETDFYTRKGRSAGLSGQTKSLAATLGDHESEPPSISNTAILAAAGSIVQVEARHVAATGLLAHQPVTPTGGFDAPLTTAQVLAMAGPLIQKS